MSPVTAMPRPSVRRAQAGSFLLEALIAILIIALAVLGLVGLLAHSMQNVDDAKFRGEAAYLASSYIGEMWGADRATLNANFDDTSGGAKYAAFKAVVQQRLPHTAATPLPVVTITPGVTPTSSQVEITITWQPPGDQSTHQHVASATIGTN